MNKKPKIFDNTGNWIGTGVAIGAALGWRKPKD